MIVDDEEAITTLIDYNLMQAGFETEIAHEGETACEKAKAEDIDLIVLDWMLPKLSGLEILEKLRKEGIEKPVIMLTAKTSEEDLISGLEYGADDYIKKPFSPKELIARIKSVLRRIQEPEQEKITIGNITIYPKLYEVYKDEELVEFTKKEFDLLLYLAQRKNVPVPREELLRDVWDFEFIGDTRIVDVHISHLREKLEKEPKSPSLILTVRGVGYKIEG